MQHIKLLKIKRFEKLTFRLTEEISAEGKIHVLKNFYTLNELHNQSKAQSLTVILIQIM